MQIRLDADVATELVKSANANERTPPRELNSLLRRVFKLKPKKRRAAGRN